MVGLYMFIHLRAFVTLYFTSVQLSNIYIVSELHYRGSSNIYIGDYEIIPILDYFFHYLFIFCLFNSAIEE